MRERAPLAGRGAATDPRCMRTAVSANRGQRGSARNWNPSWNIRPYDSYKVSRGSQKKDVSSRVESKPENRRFCLSLALTDGGGRVHPAFHGRGF